MKFLKIIPICTLLFMGYSIKAQEISAHALGFRVGDSEGLGAEISYQKKIGEIQRLEFDLGWRNGRYNNTVKLVGLYQWVKPISGAFNWYYGLGAGLGHVGHEQKYSGGDNVFGILAGNAGIEYSFDIPLQLSIDFRPEFGVLGYDDFPDRVEYDFALGIRYRF